LDNIHIFPDSDRLAEAPDFGDQIPWESVHLFWADERCIPPESEESNFGTAY
jgi:6-phosphogluconolactonase